MAKLIRLEPNPIKNRPEAGLVLDLGIIAARVLYEQGVISWQDYARAVPPELRPAKYR
jgi:hypothetical protein